MSSVAVVFARAGELPPGSDEAVAEAGGDVLVLGDGAEAAVATLVSARSARWCDTGAGLRAGRLAAATAEHLAGADLIVLPASPDGRDLAPRLAAILDRPLLAHVAAARVVDGTVQADLLRLDERMVLPAEVDAPAIATLAVGAGIVAPADAPAEIKRLALEFGDQLDVDVVEVLEPDPATMDLAEAPLVFGGGAGLAAGTDTDGARRRFELLGAVAGRLGASAGATRVATDAGWIGYERQIGTTGVTVKPRLYVAFGISGATQHTGGLGHPEHVISINLDPHCPMTAMADLGIVADAPEVLQELAKRLEVSDAG